MIEALTPAEMRVLEALAHGECAKVIGRRLGITPATVKSHLLHIRWKLGVDTSLQALLKALRTGLVKLEPEATA